MEFLDENKQPPRSAPQHDQVRWIPPSEQNYKGNFDAALFDDSGCAGVGVVFRDHRSQVIASLSQKIRLVRTVELAEALATRCAVQFAKELNLFYMEIEGDCSRTISALSVSRRCNTLFGHVTDECRSLGASLRFCKFIHVRREENRIAHVLARRIILSADIDVWIESLPSYLDYVFQSDLV